MVNKVYYVKDQLFSVSSMLKLISKSDFLHCHHLKSISKCCKCVMRSILIQEIKPNVVHKDPMGKMGKYSSVNQFLILLGPKSCNVRWC